MNPNGNQGGVGKQESKLTGMDAIGHPIPTQQRENANNHLKEMGIEASEDRFNCVAGVAARLEKDKPHEAMEFAMGYVDATGAYRLFAVLLT